jgi:hypothetical protein
MGNCVIGISCVGLDRSDINVTITILDRTMDNVQNCCSHSNIPSAQTYR